MSNRESVVAAGHQRARELAAARIDELLPPADEAWLADHLELCASCAVVASEYDAHHDLFGALREATPEPPRDLWARTSAEIDAERRRSRRASPWRHLRGSPGRSTRLAMAPVVALLAVVVVVGTGLLNGKFTPGGTAAAATPIAIKGAADLQVLAFDSAGNLQLLSRRVDEVCPTGVSECGVSPTFAVTAVSAFGSEADLLGAMSPSGGQMVVVRRDPGSQGVYVVPVKRAASPAPSPSMASATAVTAQMTPSQPASSPTNPDASSGTSASPSPSASPVEASPASPSTDAASPSASVEVSESPGPTGSAASASPSGVVTPVPSDSSAAASPSDGSEPPASPSASPALTVLPSVEVTPAPDAAIMIASGVTVVGAPTYSPDESHLAFSAMPSDASSGPDIYVWAVGDQAAIAITTDHDSWLAGWTDAGILVSRVDFGLPTTYTLDPATGHATAIGSPGTWLPCVSPTGTAAGWWSGTVRLAADGVTWVPDQGRLVLGAWPSTGVPVAASQVLAEGPLDGWRVRWDDTGAVVAAWVGRGNGENGQLSLYTVDETGVPDLASPMLGATTADPDFSLRAGRLAWTTPDQGQGAPQTVEVLAWSGKTVYPPMVLPADGSGTVVP